MCGVADLEQRVDQGALPVGLKCYVEIYPRPVGCVAWTLPVGWNGIPGVHHPNFIPIYNGRYEVGPGE